jgi:hypothetical protein
MKKDRRRPDHRRFSASFLACGKPILPFPVFTRPPLPGNKFFKLYPPLKDKFANKFARQDLTACFLPPLR